MLGYSNSYQLILFDVLAKEGNENDDILQRYRYTTTFTNKGSKFMCFLNLFFKVYVIAE